MQASLTAVLAGCGSISRVWLSALAQEPRVKLVGLADIEPQKAVARAKEHHFDVSIDSSLPDLLRALQPDIVFDCTTPQNRLAIARAAIESRCHVLAEKPLALTMADAEQIRDLSQSQHLTYAVMQNHRYHAGLRRLRNCVESGTLGEVTFCGSSFAIGSHFTDFRQTLPHVLIQDMAVHTFDAARYLLDSDPVSAYCKEWNPSGSWFKHGASAVAVFEFENGVIYNYQGSWCAVGLRTNWESNWRLNGVRGSIVWNGENSFSCEVTTSPTGSVERVRPLDIPELKASGKQGHAGAIEDFADSILAGRAPHTRVEDNFRTLHMVLAAIESSNSGRTVVLQG